MSGLSHEMVAHTWAHGVRGRGYAMFSDGTTIYSWGEHFPIARHIVRPGRPGAVLFTTRGYSKSTATHIGIVRQAIPAGTPVFHVRDPAARPRSVETRRQYEARLESACKAVLTARTRRAERVREVGEIINEGNACAEYFGWRWRLVAPRDYAQWASNAEAQRTRARAREIADRNRRMQWWRAREIADRDRRMQWWRGGDTIYHGDFPDVLLRIKGARVETSKGAKFPVHDAMRAFAWIKRCRDTGQEFHAADAVRLPLGHFQVDYISATGDVTAGCHHVRWAEIERLARALGLVEGGGQAA